MAGSSNAKNYPELKSWLVETADVFWGEVLPLFENSGVMLHERHPGLRRAELVAEIVQASTAPLPTPVGGSDSKSSRSEDREEGEEVKNPAGAVTEFAGSEVFDYENRVLIYAEDGASGNMPAPTHGQADAFSRACVKRTEELVMLSRGRALVILSTNRAVSIFRERPSPYRIRSRYPGR